MIKYSPIRLAPNQFTSLLAPKENQQELKVIKRFLSLWVWGKVWVNEKSLGKNYIQENGRRSLVSQNSLEMIFLADYSVSKVGLSELSSTNS